jgi:hypothetical protein
MRNDTRTDVLPGGADPTRARVVYAEEGTVTAVADACDISHETASKALAELGVRRRQIPPGRNPAAYLNNSVSPADAGLSPMGERGGGDD